MILPFQIIATDVRLELINQTIDRPLAPARIVPPEPISHPAVIPTVTSVRLDSIKVPLVKLAAGRVGLEHIRLSVLHPVQTARLVNIRGHQAKALVVIVLRATIQQAVRLSVHNASRVNIRGRLGRIDAKIVLWVHIRGLGSRSVQIVPVDRFKI
jgi:hypothetical protein